MIYIKSLFFKYKTIAITGIILIDDYCSIGCIAQDSTIDLTNVQYKANIGDKNIYEVVNSDVRKYEFFSNQFTLNKGTQLFYNLTKGVKLAYTIILIIPATLSGTDAYLTSELTLQNNETYPGVTYLASYFGIFYHTLENESMVIAYYSQTRLFGFNNVSIKGDFISVYSNQTFSDLTSQITSKYNWKTGWLESKHIYRAFTNETVIEDTLLQRESTVLADTVISESKNLTLIGGEIIVTVATIASVIILFFLAISYRKFIKSNNNQRNISFKSFVKKKTKRIFIKETLQFNGHNTDKALEIIEQILEETSE